MPTTQTPVPERFDLLPVLEIAPSRTNPRKHFDPAYIAELSESIRTNGLAQPILVRPVDRIAAGIRYEIVAGECRFRATKQADLDLIPAVIRALTDEQVLDLQLIENIHRRNLTDLEEARGYRRLIDTNPTKHSAESIARRIGMSTAYVWDRLKLNDLVPAAATLLERGRMGVAHAIVIARQKPEDQRRIVRIDRDEDVVGGLWEETSSLDFDEADPKAIKADPAVGYKPVTVRELERWVSEHIRFDVVHAGQAQPLQFEAIADQVATAAAQPGRGKKVIALTFEHFVQPEARGEDRTFGPKSFKFADGEQHVAYGARSNKPTLAPTCEHAVLGLVAAGAEHYGETFQVCIARDKCRVHYGAEIKAREHTQRLRDAGQKRQADRAEQQRQAREEKSRQEEEAKRQRFGQFKTNLRAAVNTAAAKQPKQLTKSAFAFVLKANQLPSHTTPANLATALLEDAIADTFKRAYGVYDEPRLVALAKALGVDVQACEPAKPKAGKKGKAA